MKTLNTLLLFLCSSMVILAQSKLADSPRRSQEIHIYKVEKENLQKVHMKDQSYDESMLTTLVASYNIKDPRPQLPKGNYVEVKTIENKLNFDELVIDNLNAEIIPSERFEILLYDTLGNIIQDAEVMKNKTKLKFDPSTQTYYANNAKENQILEIVNQGVYHYYNVYDNSDYYHTWKPKKTKIEKSTGFVVFSKPKYKPGETVKLKAFLTNKRGKRYEKPVLLKLKSYYSSRKDTTLVANLDPYRPGMYNYEFQLTDGLDLTLDQSYLVSLMEDGKDLISGTFRYEDYELKGINFSFTTDKTNYIVGDSILMKTNVVDENGLPSFDGSVEITVLPYNTNLQKSEALKTIFVPDTLWHETIDMSGISQKEILLPDSIFPPINLNLSIFATYLSADNEKHTKNLYLNRQNKEYEIEYKYNNGMLEIQQLYRGISTPAKALLIVEGAKSEILQSDSITLPHSLSVPWFAQSIYTKTQDTENEYIIKNINPISADFYRKNDSIHLDVDNPAEIPFWYTIRRKNKDIAKGYTTKLNYATKDNGKDGYNMQIHYLLGGVNKSIPLSLPHVDKALSMEVNTPDTIYPGQKTSVEISLKNKKGNPVPDADVTAYAYTSKFQERMPYVPVQWDIKTAKQFYTKSIGISDDWISNFEAKLTWDRWSKSLNLDSIEYYKFLYPNQGYYERKEPTADKSTLIAPFVVIDGEVQGVQMLWIDDRLYYYKEAEQQERYVFEVSPGKHKLRFRTYDREINVYNVEVKEGEKHILSFDASKSEFYPIVRITSEMMDKERRGFLSFDEKKELENQLITINSYFGRVIFPNNRYSIEMPGYIKAGNTLYYVNHSRNMRYNPSLNVMVADPILVGPFPQRSILKGFSNNIMSVYANGELQVNTEIEGGNLYTTFPNYQKIKGWGGSPINNKLFPYTQILNFTQLPITEEEIEADYQDKMLKQMQSSYGSVKQPNFNQTARNIEYPLILMSYGKEKPALIFIEPKKEEDRSKYLLYYGNTNKFTDIKTEESILHLIYNDSTSYSLPIKLRKGGKNYLRLDSLTLDKNSSVAKTAYKLFENELIKQVAYNPYVTKKDTIISYSAHFENKGIFVQSNKDKGIITGMIQDREGPLIGATVAIKDTNQGCITDFDGRFTLRLKDKATLEIRYLGYETKIVDVQSGYDYEFILEYKGQTLNDAVVVGYDAIIVSQLTGSVRGVNVDEARSTTDSRLLARKEAPVTVGSSRSSSAQLLSLKDEVMADEAVVIEDSISLNDVSEPLAQEEIPEEGQQGIRRNFHDDAFWQPQLRTDKNGEVSFEVTYPDDITNWKAYFIALDAKNQSDTKEINIKSFKSIAARLSVPRFAVRGDSINAIGRINNFTPDSLKLNRTIVADGEEHTQALVIDKSYLDRIPVHAIDGDSLSLSYTIETEKGYFDGEERSLPIMEQGMLQTYGDFNVINDDKKHQLQTDPQLGTITVHAEATSFQIFMEEVESIDRYPYFCNEQLASKIKALLAKKYLLELQGEKFKENKNINKLIQTLNKNRNSNGLWGWWNKSQSITWISKHIISALLDAEEAGYKTDLKTQNIALGLNSELKKAIYDLKQLKMQNEDVHFNKGELMDKLMLLKRLNSSQVDYISLFREMNVPNKNETIKDKLKTMLAMSEIGLGDSIQIDSLMQYSNKTLFGSMYWEVDKPKAVLLRYYVPYETNVENTLLAYQTLRNLGGHEKELASIQNYFFELRKRGWNNIYESSRIMQTIMPDLLKKDQKYENPVMTINGNQVSKFPYTAKFESTETIEVSKVGTSPLFVTAHQEAWNPNPKKEDKKGFSISTAFMLNNDTIANLTEGKATNLQVTLVLDGAAEYVQIEVPIPAGCTYDSKHYGYFWKESHREYFKDKVVIFCENLAKGEHVFNIDLLPRYTGKYTLNPAKAELMYFPTFYGNEDMKTTVIQ